MKGNSDHHDYKNSDGENGNGGDIWHWRGAMCEHGNNYNEEIDFDFRRTLTMSDG